MAVCFFTSTIDTWTGKKTKTLLLPQTRGEALVNLVRVVAAIAAVASRDSVLLAADGNKTLLISRRETLHRRHAGDDSVPFLNRLCSRHSIKVDDAHRRCGSMILARARVAIAAEEKYNGII